MRYGIVFSPSAERGINGLLHYQNTRNGQPSAINLYKLIRAKVEGAAVMPYRHPPLYFKGEKFDDEYRFILIDRKARIIYQVSDDTSTINVVLVIHPNVGANRIRELLQEE